MCRCGRRKRRADNSTCLTHVCKVMQFAQYCRNAELWRAQRNVFLCRLEGATWRPQSRVSFENGLGNRKIKFTECRQRDGNKNTFNSIGGECLLRQPLLAEMSAGWIQDSQEQAAKLLSRQPGPRCSVTLLSDNSLMLPSMTC